MAEQEQPKYDGPERRHAESEIVEHVRAADTVLELARRWGTIIVLIIGFGWMIRGYDSGFNDLKAAVSAQGKSLDDFKLEVRGRFDQISGVATKASTDAHDLQLRYEQLAKDIDAERLRGQTRDLQIQKYGEWIEGQKALQSRGR